mmetsp:Transcript_27925/g.41331  ORF Transcript_27925/g.41331 Transcript_27925/m.41331 type:complete len:764 (+) Transcript_27925:61-2352(+)
MYPTVGNIPSSSKRDTSNPWGNQSVISGGTSTDTVGSSNGPPPSSSSNLSSIMEQQAEERVMLDQIAEMELLSAANKQQHEENEEERQLRLAIEASLLDAPVSIQRAPAETVASVTVQSSPPGAVAVPNASIESGSTEEHIYATNMTVVDVTDFPGMSQEEKDQIKHALKEEDDREHAASLALAMELEREEKYKQSCRLKKERSNLHFGKNSNVKTMHAEDFHALKQSQGSAISSSVARAYATYDNDDHFDTDDDVDDHEDHEESIGVGFRCNAGTKSSWTRMDASHSIMGPNGEVRTKHDLELKHRSNAHRLGLDGDSAVSDKAYNSFRNKLKKGTVKGVASQGHGRAENMTHDRTRGGALDGAARLQIQKAINKGLIANMNGAVKEGKEAIVYHADGPTEGGHDVAVKIFKRIQEFRQRGDYVDGDPRYSQRFSSYGKREQMELWAEKEFRNLVRANSAGVPSPAPIVQKHNLLFMRFLGEDGWPAPQLREVHIKHGSKKWMHLYCQTMLAVRKLYHCALLVHGDLSEYNLLLCPSFQVGHDDDKGVSGDAVGKDDLQVVLIDFGQAVHRTHPSADVFLHRDLNRVKFFFENQGIRVLSEEDATDFILMDPAETFEDKVQVDEKAGAVLVDEKPKINGIDNEQASDFEFIPVTNAQEDTDRDDFVVVTSPGESCADTKDEGSNASDHNNQVTDEEMPASDCKANSDPVFDETDAQWNEIIQMKELTVETNETVKWRHKIQGWDDDKDYQNLQDMLTNATRD